MKKRREDRKERLAGREEDKMMKLEQRKRTKEFESFTRESFQRTQEREFRVEKKIKS